MLIRTNTILNACMTDTHDHLTRELLPHYATFLSNKVPDWTCPTSMRREGQSGVGGGERRENQ